MLGCKTFRRGPSPGFHAKACSLKVRNALVKKLILLALIALGGLAVWRKVQSDRAELDLWTEATTGD